MIRQFLFSNLICNLKCVSLHVEDLTSAFASIKLGNAGKTRLLVPRLSEYKQLLITSLQQKVGTC